MSLNCSPNLTANLDSSDGRFDLNYDRRCQTSYDLDDVNKRHSALFSCSSPNITRIASLIYKEKLMESRKSSKTVSKLREWLFGFTIAMKSSSFKDDKTSHKDDDIFIPGKVGLYLYAKYQDPPNESLPYFEDTFNFYVDPLYHPLPKDPLYIDPDRHLIELKGEHLDLFHVSSDISITIGTDDCPIHKLTSTYVSCIPPRLVPDNNITQQEKNNHDLKVKSQKRSLSGHELPTFIKTRDGHLKYRVRVKAGSLIFYPGWVAFSISPISSSYIWAILASLLIFIFSSLFIFLTVWRRRRTKRKKKRKRLTSLSNMRYTGINTYPIPSTATTANYEDNQDPFSFSTTSSRNDYSDNTFNLNEREYPQILDDPSSLFLPERQPLEEHISVLRSTDKDNKNCTERPGNLIILEESPIKMVGNLLVDGDLKLLVMDPNIILSRSTISLGPLIGKGNFGRVYKAKYILSSTCNKIPDVTGLTPHNSPNTTTTIDVAVKTLNTSILNPESLRAFLHEGLRMKEFKHPNVMPLIGISWSKTQRDKCPLPLVVLPYMPNGDLLSHLRKPTVLPTLGNLLEWALQIARGMEYLASLKFVHRDLAARNCMLDEEFRVVIADFGLTRDIYEKDYYSSSNKGNKLPVKWMALESLQKNIYNTKTDVWSYGIVLWELVTRGINPYPHVDNWEIINFLLSGRRLEQPLYCPDSLYKIMLECWDLDSTLRPGFAKIIELIDSVVKELSVDDRIHRVYEYDTIFYYNIPPPKNNAKKTPATNTLQKSLVNKTSPSKLLSSLQQSSNGRYFHSY